MLSRSFLRRFASLAFSFVDAFFATLYFGDEPFGTDLEEGSFLQAVSLLRLNGGSDPYFDGELVPSGRGEGWFRFAMTYSTPLPFVTLAFELVPQNTLPGDSLVAVDNVSLIRIDTQSPVLTLNGQATVILECAGDPYIELGAEVSDEVDPNVAVIIGGDLVDVTTPGTYLVTYDAVDVSGNAAAQLTRTVTVIDTTAPVLTLNGAAELTLEYGVDPYTEAGATATDTCDPNVAVIIGGDPVDVTTPGTYPVTYDAVDASGNAAAQLTRTVIVVDLDTALTIRREGRFVVVDFTADLQVNRSLKSDAWFEVPGASGTVVLVPARNDELETELRLQEDGNGTPSLTQSALLPGFQRLTFAGGQLQVAGPDGWTEVPAPSGHVIVAAPGAIGLYFRTVIP